MLNKQMTRAEKNKILRRGKMVDLYFYDFCKCNNS